ncbi:MAG: hypothetical protein QWI73_03185 [Alphaproteobacteria bacterium]|nr:hypothetical protein [Alphaproteobacteria bacterium]
MPKTVVFALITAAVASISPPSVNWNWAPIFPIFQLSTICLLNQIELRSDDDVGGGGGGCPCQSLTGKLRVPRPPAECAHCILNAHSAHCWNPLIITTTNTTATTSVIKDDDDDEKRERGRKNRGKEGFNESAEENFKIKCLKERKREKVHTLLY